MPVRNTAIAGVVTVRRHPVLATSLRKLKNINRHVIHTVAVDVNRVCAIRLKRLVSGRINHAALRHLRQRGGADDKGFCRQCVHIEFVLSRGRQLRNFSHRKPPILGATVEEKLWRLRQLRSPGGEGLEDAVSLLSEIVSIGIEGKKVSIDPSIFEEYCAASAKVEAPWAVDSYAPSVLGMNLAHSGQNPLFY